MKKIALTILYFFTCITIVNAQTILGGSFGIGGKLEKQNNEIISNTLNLTFSPRVGYCMSDKIEIGCALKLAYNYESKQNLNEVDLLVTPCVRYCFAKKGRVHFGICMHVGLGGTVYTNRTFLYQDSTKIEFSNNNYSNFKYDIYVIPSLQIKNSEHLYTEIDFNALGIGINGSKQVYTTEGGLQMSLSSFKWGLHMFSNTDYLRIGAIYKF